MFDSLPADDKKDLYSPGIPSSSWVTRSSLTEQTCVASERAPKLLSWQACNACLKKEQHGTIYCCCFVFREAMLLGPASAAVQRAGTGRSGRSCQQADGQVCRKVSTETALPVRKAKTMVGKSWALIVRRAIFTHSEWGGGWGNQSFFTWQQKLAHNSARYSNVLMEQFLSRRQIRQLRSEGEEILES